MNCEDTMKFSFTYLDGEFDDRDKVEFEAHLSACGHCRGSVEHDAKFRDAVRKHLVAPPVEADFKARLAARLDESERERHWSRSAGVPLALAAALAAAIGVSQLLGTTAPEPGHVIVAAQDSQGEHAVAKAAVKPESAGDSATAKARISGNKAVAQAAVGAVRAPAKVASAAVAGQVRLVNNDRSVSIGAIAGVAGQADEGDWPVAEARSPAGLRTLVKLHATPLPDEVQGGASKVQAYLGARMRGVGAPPIGEGTGVHITGARFSQIAGHPVVVYRYSAFSKPLTALRFLQPEGAAPFAEDKPRPGIPGEERTGLDGTLDDHLAGYTVLHVLRGGTRFALISELELEPMKALLSVQ